MNSLENIKKKITVDFLVKKIEISLNTENGYSGIDKQSVKLLLGKCGYQSISKRGLELFEKNMPEHHVIVNDALLGRYETSVSDVVLRKSPTIKEMISFKNARKILGDSDVLRSVKKDTLEYLRSSYINSLDFSDLSKDKLVSELRILFDADDIEGFFKLVLVLFELSSLNYLPFLSKKYNLYILGKKNEKENDSFFYPVGILDYKNKKFLFAKNEIREKKIIGILSGKEENKVFSEGEDAICELAEVIEDTLEYLPFESNLFLYGLPENFNF